jgi:hypothetical protein
MEIIEGNFNKQIETKATVEDGLRALLEDGDLSSFDEMIVVLNSSKGNGTAISTNCNIEVTHFLLHYAALTLLSGETTAGE